MAFLGRARKDDLVQIAKEMEIKIHEQTTVVQLRENITKSKQFEEEFAKGLLESIISERIERNEKEKLEAERKFEIEKIIAAGKDEKKSHEDSSEIEHSMRKLDSTKFIKRFEIGEDIHTFLCLFERQLKRLKVNKAEWTTHLLGLIPLELVKVISKEEEEDAENYDYIKEIFLRRYQFHKEDFRNKFFYHQKQDKDTWQEYAFNLKSYLEAWIDGNKVTTFEELKDLLIVNQIRHRLPVGIKQDLIDDLPKTTGVKEMTEKLEEYDTNRRRLPQRKQKPEAPRVPERRGNFQRKWSSHLPEKSRPEKAVVCYQCGKTGHTRNNCYWNQSNNRGNVNNNNRTVPHLVKEVKPEGKTHHTTQKS